MKDLLLVSTSTRGDQKVLELSLYLQNQFGAHSSSINSICRIKFCSQCENKVIMQVLVTKNGCLSGTHSTND